MKKTTLALAALTAWGGLAASTAPASAWRAKVVAPVYPLVASVYPVVAPVYVAPRVVYRAPRTVVHRAPVDG